ncbi:MAG: TA system VapC family ribonuclease toxin [Rhizomicrobium sp.]
MILIDANILLCAGVTFFPQHERARTWLDEQLSGTAPVGLPWHSLLAFLRITTNPRAFTRHLRMAEAWRLVDDWLACAPAWIPQPTERHGATLRELLDAGAAYGDLVSDAHLAALAIEHELTVCTNDKDFSRFPNVRWTNPLTAQGDPAR